MKPIISSTLIRGLNKGCISNENVSVIEEYFDNNGSIIDKDGAPAKALKLKGFKAFSFLRKATSFFCFPTFFPHQYLILIGVNRVFTIFFT